MRGDVGVMKLWWRVMELWRRSVRILELIMKLRRSVGIVNLWCSICIVLWRWDVRVELWRRWSVGIM